MSRKNRIWYPGATYHVMSRGIRRTAIFKDQTDYELFNMILKKTKEKYAFALHSYCMMTNHIHLQITTDTIEPGKIMNYLFSNYARTFNRKYEYTGHLFESRYTACLIEEWIYFLEVSRYIHLNPVRAGIVRNPLDYPYSSYGSYILQKPNPLLETRKILSFFPDNPMEQYKMFVESAVSHEEHESVIQKEIGEDENWLPY